MAMLSYPPCLTGPASISFHSSSTVRANPIDFDIRPKIAEIMPNLTGQFIAFMISSEREKFLPGLRRAAGTEIQYITLFRKGARHLEEKALASPSCVETRDGFHVTGERFFEDFQLDDEDG